MCSSDLGSEVTANCVCHPEDNFRHHIAGCASYTHGGRAWILFKASVARPARYWHLNIRYDNAPIRIAVAGGEVLSILINTAGLHERSKEDTQRPPLLSV